MTNELLVKEFDPEFGKSVFLYLTWFEDAVELQEAGPVYLGTSIFYVYANSDQDPFDYMRESSCQESTVIYEKCYWDTFLLFSFLIISETSFSCWTHQRTV